MRTIQLGIGHRAWIPANCPLPSFPERDFLRREAFRSFSVCRTEPFDNSSIVFARPSRAKKKPAICAIEVAHASIDLIQVALFQFRLFCHKKVDIERAIP